MNLRDIDLKKLNSITKYPSIPTYHVMDDRGRLTEERQVVFGGEVYLSEKVDGTNSRLIVSPDGDYIIGSREELLHARGDRIWNPSMGIVDAVRPVAERFFSGGGWTSAVMVLFMETYGGNVGGNAKQYTGSRAVSVRLFDVIVFDGQLEEMARRSPEEIAAWRENGGQPFVPSEHTAAYAVGLGIEPTPRLGVVDASEIPASIAGTAEWLASKLDRTRCAIDGGAGGAPEGIIARSADRSRIAKLRFEDYRRTLKGARK